MFRLARNLKVLVLTTLCIFLFLIVFSSTIEMVNAVSNQPIHVTGIWTCSTAYNGYSVDYCEIRSVPYCECRYFDMSPNCITGLIKIEPGTKVKPYCYADLTDITKSELVAYVYYNPYIHSTTANIDYVDWDCL